MIGNSIKKIKFFTGKSFGMQEIEDKVDCKRRTKLSRHYTEWNHTIKFQSMYLYNSISPSLNVYWINIKDGKSMVHWILGIHGLIMLYENKGKFVEQSRRRMRLQTTTIKSLWKGR